MTDFIPLSFPDITDAEVRAVVSTLRSGRLSTGPRLEEFENLVAGRCRRSYGVGVSSGTAALQVVLAGMGIGPGDEVLTPAFSFVASANCILYVGARPVFVDCDPRTLNMDAEKAEAAITPRTRAIIGVEVFGNPAGMRDLASLATKHEIPLIEDACEGLGGREGQDLIGGFGRAAVFGFYPNKQITTGEGGMIVTDDDHLAAACRSLRNHGRPYRPFRAPSPEDEELDGTILGSMLQHERLGWNFRLNELSAALGCAQMQRFDELIEARQLVAEAYTRRLMGNADLLLPTVEPDTFMSWFTYVVRLSDRFSDADRDEIIAGLRRHEVGATNYFPPIHLLPHFRTLLGHGPGDFPVAESVSQRTIALPLFTRLTEREVDLVCQTLDLMMTRMAFSRE